MDIDKADLQDDLRAWLDDLSVQAISELKHLSDNELRNTKLLPVFARRYLDLDIIKAEIEDVWVSWS